MEFEPKVPITQTSDQDSSSSKGESRSSMGETSLTTNSRTVCPFCAENIQVKAILCRYCGQDLRLFASLNQRLIELEHGQEPPAVSSPNDLLDDLRIVTRRIEIIENLISGKSSSVGDIPLELTEPFVPITSPMLPNTLTAAITLPLLSSLFLILLYFLIVIILNQPIGTDYLLLATFILAPLPFGFSHAARCNFRYAILGMSAIGMATIATFTMSGIVSLTSQVPWMPQNFEELRQIALSIICSSCSYIAGGLIAKRLDDRLRPRITTEKVALLAKWILKWLGHDGPLPQDITATVDLLQKISNNVLLVIPIVASAWAGFLKFLN